jgi:cytochrome P450
MVIIHRVPAKTIIMYSLTGILNDPKLFPEPEKFKPERFLEIDPQSSSTDHQKKVFKPHPSVQAVFGIGKRECIGKNLAKMELYLFMAALLHQFDFTPSDTKILPSVGDFSVSITRVPAQFDAKITSRH